MSVRARISCVRIIRLPRCRYVRDRCRFSPSCAIFFCSPSAQWNGTFTMGRNIRKMCVVWKSNQIMIAFSSVFHFVVAAVVVDVVIILFVISMHRTHHYRFISIDFFSSSRSQSISREKLSPLERNGGERKNKVGEETERRREEERKILTQECEVWSAVANELYERFSHRLAKPRVRRNNVGYWKQRKKHT